jgi:RimJ/RimL family protein N-acetyltransferase
MVQLLDWWPKPEYGLLGYLPALPAFGSWGAVMLYLIDWYVVVESSMDPSQIQLDRFNRPPFEDASLNLLRRPDVADIAKHYQRSSSSGFFILEYDGKFVGLIAIDASKDSQSQDSLMDNNKLPPSLHTKKKKDITSLGSSPVATIRHFYIVEPYRTTGIQEDLLAHAVQHAFKADLAVKEIKATTTSLIPYTQKCLRKAGFVLEKPLDKLGMYGWKSELVVLRRTRWEQESARTVL